MRNFYLFYIFNNIIEYIKKIFYKKQDKFICLNYHNMLDFLKKSAIFFEKKN